MDVLLQEVEALEAILLDDVITKRHPETDCPEMIETTVFPTVGESGEKYVCLTLSVIFSANYPNEKPQFRISNPRGLSEECLAAIDKAIGEKLTESLGQPVVFDLIDVIREHLTESNLPTGQCVICLYGFCEGDQFTKTGCYHYLHSHCLASHLTASKRNYEEEVAKLPAWQQKEAKPFCAFCPVCRETIEDIEVAPLFAAQPPKDLENAPNFVLTNELKCLQQEMSRLYLRQKQRGGIIDLEAEEATVLSLGLLEEQQAANNNSNTRRSTNVGAAAATPNNRQTHQVNQAARLRNQQLAASKNREKIEKDSSEEDSEKNGRPIGRHNKKRHHHRHRHANGKTAQTSAAASATSSSNIPNASGGKNR